MYDLIIVGAGPAGVSAGIYARRARLNAVVLEKQPMSGGQVINTYEVDNYPGLPKISGMELSDRFREHGEKLGVSFAQGDVSQILPDAGFYKVVTHEKTYETKTVILATGAAHRKLGVKGEEALAGMGVSYCATCDGAFFKNRTVCVVGGGDVAVEDAIFLARICKKVYLIHRRDELRAARVLQEKLFSLENVEVLWDTVVEEICGSDMVEEVALYHKKKDCHDRLAVDGVFVAVGITPNSETFRGLTALDEGGYIVAGEDGVTDAAGIFAAGDVRTKQLRQILTAAADGANAVTSVQEYLIRLQSQEA